MVNQCVVCKISSKSNQLISFHRFPKEKSRRDKWITNLNIDHVNDSTCICSQHFKKSDFKDPIIESSRPLLKSTAVPSMDIISENDENKSWEIKETRETNNLQSDAVTKNGLHVTTDDTVHIESLKRQHPGDKDEISIPLKNVRRLGDIDVNEVVKSPEEAKICLEVALDIIKEQRQKIKYFQTKTKRLEESVKILKSILKNLKDNNFFLPEDSETFSE